MIESSIVKTARVLTCPNLVEIMLSTTLIRWACNGCPVLLGPIAGLRGHGPGPGFSSMLRHSIHLVGFYFGMVWISD